MSSPNHENEEPSSTNFEVNSEASGSNNGEVPEQRPPAKRPLSTAVIEISDTESDDSDVCAVTTYQATADEVKRIRQADYSSSSSSSDYSSDSESPWEDDSYVVEDKVQPKLVKAQLNVRANRMDEPKLNTDLKSQELLDRLQTHWKEEKDLSSKEVTFSNNPFRLCLLHNVLSNPEIINNIVDDMNTLDWSRKKMDLYEFHQTTDLANLTWQRSIRGIYELFKTEVMDLVAQVTGMELKSVSASCSLYGPGDHLLIHDDRLGNRRVAFILYLAPWTPRTPRSKSLHNGANHKAEGDSDGKMEPSVETGWRETMGGALELLRLEGEEARVVRRVLPANNTLAFFPVGPTSFHQVAEVLSMELPRLSINGWFHGPGPQPETPVFDVPPMIKPHNEVVLLSEWIESAYMTPRNRAQVQAQMERASEVCLRDFLLPAKYAELLQQLRGTEVRWEWCGPARQRRCERLAPVDAAPAVEGAPTEGAPAEGAPAEDVPAEGGPEGVPAEGVPAEGGPGAGAGGVPGAAGALLSLLGSASFVRMLTACTGLSLARLLPPQLQRWRAGSHSLLPPRECYARARLEAVLYVGVPAHALCGGGTVYVAPEDAAEGALVSLPPASNALNLVYCDAGAASFTKYLSRLTMSEDECFYIVTCAYGE